MAALSPPASPQELAQGPGAGSGCGAGPALREGVWSPRCHPVCCAREEGPPSWSVALSGRGGLLVLSRPRPGPLAASSPSPSPVTNPPRPLPALRIPDLLLEAAVCLSDRTGEIIQGREGKRGALGANYRPRGQCPPSPAHPRHAAPRKEPGSFGGSGPRRCVAGVLDASG